MVLHGVHLPEGVLTHIAVHMSDDIRGVDPACYRAACILQAAWRNFIARTQHTMDFIDPCRDWSGFHRKGPKRKQKKKRQGHE